MPRLRLLRCRRGRLVGEPAALPAASLGAGRSRAPLALRLPRLPRLLRALVCVCVCALLAAAVALPSRSLAAAPPPCAIAPEGSLPVPAGFTPEQYRDHLRAALEDGSSESESELELELPPLCTPPPDAGGYYISDPVLEQQSTGLNYTARDWSRWDGFDLQTDLLVQMTRFAAPGPDSESGGGRVWGIGNGRTDVQLRLASFADTPLSSPAAGSTGSTTLTPSLYLRFFRSLLGDTYYPRGYAWFRGFGRNAKLDYIEEFKKSGRIDLASSLINVSFALNENYNIFRAAQRKTIRTRLAGQRTDLAAHALELLVDQEFDRRVINWRVDMPRNKAILTWLERLLDTIRAKQALTPGTMRKAPTNLVDVFGLFEGMDGAGYNVQFMIFYAYQWAHLCGHYLKLLSTPAVRNVRRSMYAQLSALHRIWQSRGGGPIEDRLTSQGTLRIVGWTGTAYTALRTEAVLKERGEWSAADAAYSQTTDWAKGKVTNSDLLARVDAFATAWVDRIRQWGHTESLSTYYGFVLDVLTTGLLHAPSQSSYRALEQEVKMLWYDLANNYLPSAAATSGASGRHYDFTTGVHGKQDYWEMPLFVAPLFRPFCARKEVRKLADGSRIEQTLNLCTANTPRAVPSSVEPTHFELLRFQLAAAQAAGYTYLPFDALVNITLSEPTRCFYALQTNQRGQERFNFLAPGVQMGWQGEGQSGVGTSNVLVARLGGEPQPNTPKAVVSKRAPTTAHAYLRLLAENRDMPFHRESTYGGVAHEIPILARLVVAQHQGFMLTTSFLAGRSRDKGATNSRTFNTDLILPITVQRLQADGVDLPITKGTLLALPLATIFTARHNGWSICIRVLRLEVAPGIKHASKRTALSNADGRYNEGRGQQEYSLTWQVDDASILAGSGRVTLHHKHAGVAQSQGGWRVATLWAAGRTSTDQEQTALEKVVREAVLTDVVNKQNGWDGSDQPWAGKPRRAWDGSSPLGQAAWDISVQIRDVTLKVGRTDVYQPNTQDAKYRHPVQPLNDAPFYLGRIERLVQGKDMFEERFGQAYGASSWRGPGMQRSNVPTNQLFEPHLAPRYSWQSGAWSLCSASCGGGTRTRSVTCLEGSSSGTAVAASLCPSTGKPVSQEACASLACPPGAPTIRSVVPSDGSALVSFDPPSTGDLAAILRYQVLTTRAPVVAMLTTTSPVRVVGLTNGQVYQFRVAAVTSGGMGTPTSASGPVTPDVYRWTLSEWAACSKPCGGGTQDRTLSCVGEVVGPTSHAWCRAATPAPTTLSQACNTQPCAWHTADWSACSARCAGGISTRAVTCTNGLLATPSRTSLADTFCPATTRPLSSTPCNTQLCEWTVEAWGSCSAPCNGGTRTRAVHCSQGRVCESVRPATVQACNTDACAWTATPFGDCSAECGEGVRTRTVACANASGVVMSDEALCPSSSRPSTSEPCSAIHTCHILPVTPSLVSVLPGNGSVTIEFQLPPGVAANTSTFVIGVRPVAPAAEAFVDFAPPAPVEAVEGAPPPPQVGALDVDALVQPEWMQVFGTSSPIVVEGLVNGAMYHFSISAANEFGWSNGSAAASVAFEPYAPPEPPELLALQGEEGGVVSVEFEPPARLAGQPPPLIVVTTEPPSAAANGTESPIALHGLSAEVEYLVRMMAVNPAGHSEWKQAQVSVAPLTSAPAAEAEAASAQTPDGGGASMGAGALAAAIGVPVAVSIALLVAAGVWWRRRSDAKSPSERPSSRPRRESAGSGGVSAAASAAASRRPSKVLLDVSDMDAAGEQHGSVQLVSLAPMEPDTSAQRRPAVEGAAGGQASSGGPASPILFSPLEQSASELQPFPSPAPSPSPEPTTHLLRRQSVGSS